MFDKSELVSRSFDLGLRAPSPEGEGTDWGMLKILGGLFVERLRGVEDGAAAPTANA